MSKKIKPVNDTSKRASVQARAKIIKVATELFGEQGLEPTTTRQISAASGLNISLISYYFGGKVGLYQAIIYEHALKIKEEFEAIFESHHQEKFTPEIFKKEISMIVRHMVEMRLHNLSMSKIFMAERTQKMPYAREVFENIMKSTTDKMIQMIQKGQDQGFLKSDLFFDSAIALPSLPILP